MPHATPESLQQAHCSACRPGSAAVAPEQLQALLAQLHGWTLRQQEDLLQLEKRYRFGNFSQALAFANALAAEAEREDHHPQLLVEWGQVRVRWWTHAVGGLHRNDFIMAARSDALLGQIEGFKPD